MTGIQNFKRLHSQIAPLVLGNVWNVQSARIYERSGYKALATSSSAVAHSLGYEDGENMTFEEYFYVIKRIAESVSIPLTVDLEGGYGNTPDEVAKHIERLASIGVVGINIEDSTVEEGVRRILGKKEAYDRLNAIVTKLKEKGIEIFYNIRTDAFLLGLEDPLRETCERIKLFEKLGADGVFVPCIISEKDIEAVVKETSLPVNVMCMPDLPDFEMLRKLGVKRISSGNFANGYIYGNLQTVAEAIMEQQAFSPLFI